MHQQGFYHGGVLLSHVLLRWPERGPCAVLDRLYNCRQVAARTAPSAARPAGHGGGSTAGAALAAAAAAATINDTGGAPNAPPPLPPANILAAAAAAAAAALPTAAAATAAMLGLAHAPPQPAPQLFTALGAAGAAQLAAGEGEAGGGRTFADLLQWAWTAYERLGTLSTGHHIELPEHEVSQGGLLPDFYLAADVSDLGRLLLRMLLQPYRQRAAGGNAPHHANPGPAVLDAPPNVDFFPPALQTLLLSMLHSATRQRPTMEQARSPTPIPPLRTPPPPHHHVHPPTPPPRPPTHPTTASTHAPTHSPAACSQVLASEWVRQPSPGVPRRLCTCWKLTDHASSCATPSDLRLLARADPPLTQANLSHSLAVRDEWLDTLAQHHADSLRRLDLTDCQHVSGTDRPLRALAQLRHLEVLRLPKERWRESDLATCLTKLHHLRCIDADALTVSPPPPPALAPAPRPLRPRPQPTTTTTSLVPRRTSARSGRRCGDSATSSHTRSRGSTRPGPRRAGYKRRCTPPELETGRALWWVLFRFTSEGRDVFCRVVVSRVFMTLKGCILGFPVWNQKNRR